MEAAGSPDESPDPKGEMVSVLVTVLVSMIRPGRVMAEVLRGMGLTYLAAGDANPLLWCEVVKGNEVFMTVLDTRALYFYSGYIFFRSLT